MSKAKPLPIDEIKDRFMLERDATGQPTGRLLYRRDIFGPNHCLTCHAGSYADSHIPRRKRNGLYRETSWTRNKNRGYFKSHRIVYFLHFGIDPGDLEIDHVKNDLLDSEGAKVNSPSNIQLLDRRTHKLKDATISETGFICVTKIKTIRGKPLGLSTFRVELQYSLGKRIRGKYRRTAIEAAFDADPLILQHFGPEAVTNRSLGLIKKHFGNEIIRKHVFSRPLPFIPMREAA